MACITLLSDFGLHDPSVAVARGILMQYSSLVPIDISHEIKPFYLPQAAYLLASSYHNFPKGTVHLLLFDLFSSASPRLILSEYKGHFFLSPDNGLLPMALGQEPANSWLCLELGQQESFIDWLHGAGTLISQIQSGASFDDKPLHRLIQTTNTVPVYAHGIIDCEVVHVDNYENVVLNITRQQYDSLAGAKPFRLQFMQVEEINELSAQYSDVREGYKLCRFNSSGHLEIGINRGKAASLFGFQTGSKHNDIKIILT
jgi:S-adenosylmethionine hydrolase